MRIRSGVQRHLKINSESVCNQFSSCRQLQAVELRVAQREVDVLQGLRRRALQQVVQRRAHHCTGHKRDEQRKEAREEDRKESVPSERVAAS